MSYRTEIKPSKILTQNQINIATAIEERPPGYFIHISITTPIASALKNEKLLYLELSRSLNGYFKPLPDPGGGSASETAAKRFRK
jgi:hypothetical protein